MVLLRLFSEMDSKDMVLTKMFRYLPYYPEIMKSAIGTNVTVVCLIYCLLFYLKNVSVIVTIQPSDSQSQDVFQAYIVNSKIDTSP